MKKKFLGLIMAVTTMFYVVIPASAEMIEFARVSKMTVDEIALTTLTVEYSSDENSNEMKKINGMDLFKRKLMIKDSAISDIELARIIYKYATDNARFVDELPDEKLLEALQFTSSVQNTNYIKVSADGEQTYLSKEQAENELTKLAELEDDIVMNRIAEASGQYNGPYENITYSSDGYMKLRTFAMKSQGQYVNRTYYSVSAYAEWLKAPTCRFEDILAVSSTATYDNAYDNYGYSYVSCNEYDSNGNFVKEVVVKREISKSLGTNTPEYISFEYSNGIGGIALRFDMYLHHTSNKVVYTDISSYVVFGCSLYNVDGNVQAGYCHKEIGLGSISVDLLSGAISFDSSAFLSTEEYYGETLGIYYFG